MLIPDMKMSYSEVSRRLFLSKRRQFVLDDGTNRLLEDLAADRAGNLSFVVREAIQLYARMEDQLLEMESNADFQRMMEQSAVDIRAGRIVSHAEVKKRARSKKRRG